MASYEDAAGVVDVIDQAAASGAISQNTAAAINAIIDQISAEGGDVAASVDNVTTNITPENAANVTAPVVLMDATTSAQATFAADSPVKAIVVGGAGGSDVKFETSDAVSVQLQGGENDSVATGSGDDAITFVGGSATIDTGEGTDTVILEGAGGNATIQGGSGNMTINIDTAIGGADGVSASIDAGDGFDAVAIAQPRAATFFQFIDGMFRMIRNAISPRAEDEMATRAVGYADDGGDAGDEGGITMQNVNVVQFKDESGAIDEITILADTKGEAMVGRLYQIALGREAIDVNAAGTNVDGLNFWFEEFGAGKDDVDLDHLARSVVNCDEFNEKYGTMSAQDFANAMFENLNAANDTSYTMVNDMTAADYAAQIESGAMSKQDVAIQIANSQAAQDVMGVNGSQYIIDGAQ